jgi:hypothetical protein
MGMVGSASVWDMAPYIKKHFGCYNALFLDAGASSAMVYSGNVLERSSRRLITDAFVVVDKETYVGLLEGTIPEGVSPYIPTYQLTEADQKFVKKLTTIIDLIYKQYGKDGYKTKLISLFRKMINS